MSIILVMIKIYAICLKFTLTLEIGNENKTKTYWCSSQVVYIC